MQFTWAVLASNTHHKNLRIVFPIESSASQFRVDAPAAEFGRKAPRIQGVRGPGCTASSVFPGSLVNPEASLLGKQCSHCASWEAFVSLPSLTPALAWWAHCAGLNVKSDMQRVEDLQAQLVLNYIWFIPSLLRACYLVCDLLGPTHSHKTSKSPWSYFLDETSYIFHHLPVASWF